MTQSMMLLMEREDGFNKEELMTFSLPDNSAVPWEQRRATIIVVANEIKAFLVDLFGTFPQFEVSSTGANGTSGVKVTGFLHKHQVQVVNAALMAYSKLKGWKMLKS